MTTPKIPQQNYTKFEPICQCYRLNKGAKNSVLNTGQTTGKAGWESRLRQGDEK
mgnify:CR=1 FL=1